MVVIELDKDNKDYARKICDLAEESIIVDEPTSFSSNLNTLVQIGVTLAPTAISAVVLIVMELIRNKKHIRIKVDDFEVEGLSEAKTLKLVEQYLKEKRDEKAKEELTKLLSAGSRE